MLDQIKPYLVSTLPACRSGRSRPGCGLLRLLAWRQVVPDLGRVGATVEGPCRIVRVLVMPRDTIVLAQVFGPVRDEEPLQPPPWIGGILTDSPIMGAITIAFAG